MTPDRSPPEMQTVDRCREEFEREFSHLDLTRYTAGDGYNSKITNRTWDGFKAAWSARPSSPFPVEAVIAEMQSHHEFLEPENDDGYSGGRTVICVGKVYDILRRHAEQAAQPESAHAIYETALRSIAANTCCDRCQEAALVAKDAITRAEQAQAMQERHKTAGDAGHAGAAFTSPESDAPVTYGAICKVCGIGCAGHETKTPQPSTPEPVAGDVERVAQWPVDVAKLPTLISHLEWTLGYAKELNRNAGYSPDYIAKCNNIVSENLAAIVAIAAMPQAGGEVGAKALRSTGRESPDYLKVLEDACWDLRCVSDPIADTGDADVLWQVVGHWMSKPHDRVIGYGYSPLAAIKDAQRPRDYEGNLIEDEDDQPKPPASAGSEGA